MIRRGPTPSYYRLACTTGAIVVALAMLPHKAVAGFVAGSYRVDIASSERLLNALGTPEEAEVQHQVSCDNPHYRVRARNKPAIKITNDVGSGGDLTGFTLRINQAAYLFGEGDTALDGFDQFIKRSAYTDPGVDITGSSLSGDGRTVTVNFSGLSAGKSAIFRVDLDTNDVNLFPFPDFRNVLFGADSGGGPGTPAVTTATFTAGGMSTTSPETALDPILGQMSFFEGSVRPYNASDPVIPSGGGGTTIPEPTSVVLLLTGALGAAALRRKRR